MPHNAAHQRRADALNVEQIYPKRALAACACYALAPDSRLPQQASTVLMKNGENFDDVALVDEIDCERETPHQNTASAKIDLCVG